MSSKKDMLVSVRNLHHHYDHGSGRIEVLRGLDLEIRRSEFLAIMGSSGSGKSTLLHVLGCLLNPSGGSYHLNGRDVLHLEEKDLARLRADTVTHIFQNFHLLPQMTVMENVLLPSLYSEIDPDEAKHNANQAIVQVGLDKRRMHRPSELSGGEMQRVAIARALAMNPELILADEPTGNLDHSSSQEILSLFRQINNQGRTIVLVTHDRDVADLAQSTLHLINGHLQ